MHSKHKHPRHVTRRGGGGREKWLGLDAVHGRIFEYYVGELF